jgi:hypothetical protein
MKRYTLPQFISNISILAPRIPLCLLVFVLFCVAEWILPGQRSRYQGHTCYLCWPHTGWVSIVMFLEVCPLIGYYLFFLLSFIDMKPNRYSIFFLQIYQFNGKMHPVNYVILLQRYIWDNWRTNERYLSAFLSHLLLTDSSTICSMQSMVNII